MADSFSVFQGAAVNERWKILENRWNPDDPRVDEPGMGTEQHGDKPTPSGDGPGAQRPKQGFFRTLSWKWVLLSIPVILIIQLLVTTIVAALGWVTLLPLVVLVAYYLGGMLIGRLSPGVTIKEPAVAVVILMVILVAVQLLFTNVQVSAGNFIFQVLFSSVVAAGLTWLGARTGEGLTASRRHAEK